MNINHQKGKIENLINKALDQKDYDVVYTYYEEKKHSFFRNIGSFINDRIANLMLKGNSSNRDCHKKNCGCVFCKC